MEMNNEMYGSNDAGLLIDLAKDGSGDGASAPTEKEASKIPPARTEIEAGTLPPTPTENEASTIPPAHTMEEVSTT